MITPERFRMVEILSADDIREHPVWADFHDGADRTRVLDWGVEPEALDRELHRYDYCGRSPLYPVLEPEDAAAARGLVNPSVAVRFELPGGAELSGYRVGDSSFVVFAGGDEFCLNPALPSRWRAAAEGLASALGLAVPDLFPIGFVECAGLGSALRRHGRIETLPDGG